MTEKEKRTAKLVDQICETLGIVKPKAILETCALLSAFEVQVREEGFKAGVEFEKNRQLSGGK